MSPVAVQELVVPVALSGTVALLAWRAGSLSRSGAGAALLVGTVCLTAGRAWGLFLVLWFVLASLASKVGQRAKAAATGDVVAKGGPRDALQVLANGGVYAAAALVALLRPEDAGVAAAIGAAALVAAGADTLATETGTLSKGRPWSLRTGSFVPTGTSGAVSVPGSVGMLLAALGFALSAHWVGLIPMSAVAAVALAGVTGAVVDTVVGAWWQARRWCPSCERETEQHRHRCGTTTVHYRGVSWLGNDAVNLLCTVAGAAAMGAILRIAIS
ncbi:DUF92 domain-containing protein [Gemmatimonas sp.]|uniref:DUF92 domain-containing protein n=2 Tax=Gemmatimonas sp. TaxID=1962908 RepID=UPI00333FC2FE